MSVCSTCLHPVCLPPAPLAAPARTALSPDADACLTPSHPTPSRPCTPPHCTPPHRARTAYRLTPPRPPPNSTWPHRGPACSRRRSHANAGVTTAPPALPVSGSSDAHCVRLRQDGVTTAPLPRRISPAAPCVLRRRRACACCTGVCALSACVLRRRLLPGRAALPRRRRRSTP
jgi:hypothetical protein